MTVRVWGLVFGLGALAVATLIGLDLIDSGWAPLAIVLSVLTVAEVSA